MAVTELEPVELTEEARPKSTVSVDFDGVIHSYVSGWEGAGVATDPPVPGAVEWLNEIGEHFEVVVMTTRAREPMGRIAVEAYLERHGVTCEFTVTGEKVPAIMYVDDRGWRFHGKFPTVKQIKFMKPWRVGDDRPFGLKDLVNKRGQTISEMQGKQSRTKREVHKLRDLLLREIVGQILDPDEVDQWMIGTETLPFEERLAAARAAGTPHGASS